MDTETCGHPACTCAVQPPQQFCGPACESGAHDVEGHDLCACGHPGCTARTAGRDLGAQSGRIGYLVLYMMGVPIGVILLLWVLFGNNLLTRG